MALSCFYFFEKDIKVLVVMLENGIIEKELSKYIEASNKIPYKVTM